ncbi:unnamed protein product [Boreogadus saida]
MSPPVQSRAQRLLLRFSASGVLDGDLVISAGMDSISAQTQQCLPSDAGDEDTAVAVETTSKSSDQRQSSQENPKAKLAEIRRPFKPGPTSPERYAGEKSAE